MARKDTRHYWWGLWGERRRLVVEGGWVEEIRTSENNVLPFDYFHLKIKF